MICVRCKKVFGMNESRVLAAPNDDYICHQCNEDIKALNLANRLLKTSELTCKALNAAVALAQGWDFYLEIPGISQPVWKGSEGIILVNNYQPSTDWKQGGPILQDNYIQLEYDVGDKDEWLASIWFNDRHRWITAEGGTMLEAGLRCFVLSKLGDTVELPKGLKL